MMQDSHYARDDAAAKAKILATLNADPLLDVLEVFAAAEAVWGAEERERQRREREQRHALHQHAAHIARGAGMR